MRSMPPWTRSATGSARRPSSERCCSAATRASPCRFSLIEQAAPPSLQLLLNHSRRRVDADDVEPIAPRVLELVGCLRADDQDVARTGLDVLAVRGKPRLAG